MNVSESIERKVKKQFAKIFTQDDWTLFKEVGEYYLRMATRLRKRHIKARKSLRLLIRNTQKRLFIGIGCELLLKASFLKNGYGINLPLNKDIRLPYKLENKSTSSLDENRTFTFDRLIKQLSGMDEFKDIPQEQRELIENGFKIAKVFRNKEAHITTSKHRFDPSNYSNIEKALVLFYKFAFNERLEIRFSIERYERPIFKITGL